MPRSWRIRPIALSRFDLVEEVRDEGLEPTPVAEEGLERPGQAAVAVGEVLAEDLVERRGGALVGLGRPGEEPLELAPDRVDVDGDPGVLEGHQADPKGALHEGRSVLGGPLRDERGEPGVGQDEPLHDDPVAVDPDHRGSGRRGIREDVDGDRLSSAEERGRRAGRR